MISETEKQILQLMRDGNVDKEIAAKLFLSVRSFKRMKTSMRNRFGCNNSVQLMAYAIDNELVPRLAQKAADKAA